MNFKETFLPKRDAIQMLESTSKPAMLGILRDEGGKHAVIFTECKEGTFTFLNNKHKNSDEPDEYRLSKDQLHMMLDELVAIGHLAPSPKKSTNFLPHLNESLLVLHKYSQEILEYCKHENPVNSASKELPINQVEKAFELYNELIKIQHKE